MIDNCLNTKKAKQLNPFSLEQSYNIPEAPKDTLPTPQKYKITLNIEEKKTNMSIGKQLLSQLAKFWEANLPEPKQAPLTEITALISTGLKPDRTRRAEMCLQVSIYINK